MAQSKKVPSVSLNQYLKGSEKDKEEFVEIFGGALKEFGFVLVSDHGVDSGLIRSSYKEAEKFFSLEDSQKRKYEGHGGQRGYTGFGKEHAKNYDKGDLKEFWHVGREDFIDENLRASYPPNVWPEESISPTFKNTFLSLYRQLDAFSIHLLDACSEYLGLEKNLLSKMVTDGNTILRVLHYPPLKNDEFRSGAVRAAAHEDINFITILCEATESGLELLNRDNEWMPIEVEPGYMVVDSGDMLSRLTNDVIPSTTHRVVNPPNAKNVSRYSMPYFVHPYSSASLAVLKECIAENRPAKFPPITANEFLYQRLKEIGLT